MGHGVRVARLKKGRPTRQPRRSKRRASKGPRPTIRQRWQNTSLKASFMVYVAFYLIIALIGSIVSSSFFAELRTGVESDEEVSGLYLFDSDDGMLYRARIIEVAVGKDVDGSPVFCTAFVQRSSDPSDALDPTALPDRCVLSDVTGLPGNAVVYVVEAQGATDFDTFSIGLDTTMLSRPAMELSPDTLAVYDELARARFNKTITEPLTTYAESAYSNGIAISPVAYNVYVMATVQQRIAILGLGVMSFLMFPLWFVGCIWIAARRFFAQRIAPALTGLDAAAEKITEQDLDFTVSYPRDDEMGNLVQSFETMRTSLAQTQRAMWHTAEEHRRLNAAFAHDLRTPLTVLHGKLELLETRAAGSKTIVPRAARPRPPGPDRAGRTPRSRPRPARHAAARAGARPARIARAPARPPLAPKRTRPGRSAALRPLRAAPSTVERHHRGTAPSPPLLRRHRGGRKPPWQRRPPCRHRREAHVRNDPAGACPLRLRRRPRFLSRSPAARVRAVL